MTDQPPTGDRPEPGQPAAPEPIDAPEPAPEPAPIDTPAPEPAPAPPPVDAPAPEPAPIDAPAAEPVVPVDAPAPTAPPTAPEMGVATAAAVATAAPVTPPAPPAAWQPPPAKPPSQPEVPGAPGRYFAATVTRVAALLIDGILLSIIAGIIYTIVAAFVPGPNLDDPTRFSALTPAVIVGGVGGLIVSFLYFYLSWRSAGKATPGQRVFKMQVGNAFDGATLTGRQITIRWLTLFGPGLLAAVPALAGLGFLALIWDIVLLVTVITSATKQGLQDRWAGSAVVATGPQNTGLAWGCLLVFVIGIVLLAALVLAALVAIFAAFFSLN